VPTDSSTISFTVSGIEDDLFFDDPIAGFTQVFGQPQNWGQGFQSGSASDSNITYTLNYTITCARDADVAVSRAALLGYARAKAEQRRVEVPTEHIGIAWSLDRLRREGWQVVAATDAQHVLRGPGTLPLLARTAIRRRWQRLTVTPGLYRRIGGYKALEIHSLRSPGWGSLAA
jgi:hypothetical protein